MKHRADVPRKSTLPSPRKYKGEDVCHPLWVIGERITRLDPRPASLTASAGLGAGPVPGPGAGSCGRWRGLNRTRLLLDDGGLRLGGWWRSPPRLRSTAPWHPTWNPFSRHATHSQAGGAPAGTAFSPSDRWVVGDDPELHDQEGSRFRPPRRKRDVRKKPCPPYRGDSVTFARCL